MDLQPISITSAINDIESFYNSQENNSKWLSLVQGSEAVFLNRLLANVISNLSYRQVTARRENFLSTANLVSSNIGLAINYGYSVYRGKNQSRLLTVTPRDNMVIPKLSVIGTYNEDYDIINLDDLSFLKYENTDIRTAIGKVKTVSFTAGTSDVTIFQLFTEGISEDFILLKDSVEMPTSKVVRDLSNDMYLVRTNPYKSVDIIYLNSAVGASYTYSTETVFEVQYIELADVPSVPFTSDMLLYCDLYNTRVIQNYAPFESNDSIKVNAPLNHETQNLIRSKKDFSKRLSQINNNIIDSSYNVLTPTYTQVSYLKDDYTLLISTEMDEILDTFDDERFMGTPLPDMVAPRKENLYLDIFLKLDGKYSLTADIDLDLDNIIQNYYEGTLAQTINTYDIEDKFNDLNYVKYARVSIKTEDRQSNSLINLGTFIEVDDVYYKASHIMGLSGGTEPSWNTPLESSIEIDTELETTDNKIIWRCYKRLSVEGLTEWSDTTYYKLGSFVYSSSYPNYMFKAVDLVKQTNSTIPDFTLASEGDYIEDGEIVWVAKTLNSSDTARQNSTSYRLGESMKTGNYSFECIGYKGLTSNVPNSQPITFELPSYTISSAGTDYFEIDGNYSSFFAVNDVIRVYISNSSFYSFSVSSVSYINSQAKTRVNVNQTVDLVPTYLTLVKSYVGTKDGEILWYIVDDPTNIEYEWDSYNVTTYDLVTST